jgi:signal transduction histidine kinase
MGTEKIENKNKTYSDMTEDEIISSYRITLTERIVRNIAHEIRNPLTNVMLGVDQLKHEIKGTDETTEVYFNIIERNCERINQMITNLVNAAKPTELILEECNLNQLLEEALSLAGDPIKAKNITVKKTFSQLPGIKADASKMRMAFEELMRNSVEAMKENEGILEIETTEENGKTFISFSDNGIGIEQEHLSRIFDPFFRIRSNGSGLGLTSTQNIINNHHGKITVVSKPGKGSVFTVSLG